MGSLVANAIGLINGPSLVGCLILALEIGQSRGKSVADAMFLVESNGILDGLVRDNIAMGKVFCNYTRTGLVFLADVFVMSGMFFRGRRL